VEKVAYALLGFVAVVWILGMIAGMVAAWPFGFFGLIAIVALGLLLIKVINERLSNKEDDYYEKNVQQ